MSKTLPKLRIVEFIEDLERMLPLIKKAIVGRKQRDIELSERFGAMEADIENRRRIELFVPDEDSNALRALQKEIFENRKELQRIMGFVKRMLMTANEIKEGIPGEASKPYYKHRMT